MRPLIGGGISASKSRVCSGLVLGGGGAFRLFERRFLSRIGPSPVPVELDAVDVCGMFTEAVATIEEDDDGPALDVVAIVMGCGVVGDIPGGVVDTTVVVIIGMTSSGVL